MMGIQGYKTYLTKAAMIGAVFLALCLLAYGVVLRPQNNSKKRLEKTLAEQKQIYASARRAAQEQTRIQLDEQIERLRDQLKGFVVDLEDSTHLTFDISQMASKENLSSLSVTTRAQSRTSRHGVAVGAKPKTHHINENHIDIKFNAGFRQFATFVNALERHRPVLFIDEFKITRSNQDESVFQVTLDVEAFVRKQQNHETADAASTSTFRANL
jgi:Tfp pilus assembly protein PilO